MFYINEDAVKYHDRPMPYVVEDRGAYLEVIHVWRDTPIVVDRFDVTPEDRWVSLDAYQRCGDLNLADYESRQVVCRDRYCGSQPDAQFTDGLCTSCAITKAFTRAA